MDQICAHRDKSSPACLIDSGLPDEGAGKVFLNCGGLIVVAKGPR